MRARRLVVVISLVATGAGALYACATTPGGPLAPLDRDDSATGTGGESDGSVADTSTLADGPEDSAAAADAADAAVVDAADAADAADAEDG